MQKLTRQAWCFTMLRSASQGPPRAEGAAPNTPACWDATRTRKTPAQPETQRRPHHAATNGSLISRVLIRPPFLLGPDSRRGTLPAAEKATDVTRFWLGRSAAQWLLISQPRRGRESDAHGREQTSAACGRVLTDKRKSFPSKKRNQAACAKKRTGRRLTEPPPSIGEEMYEFLTEG